MVAKKTQEKKEKAAAAAAPAVAAAPKKAGESINTKLALVMKSGKVSHVCVGNTLHSFRPHLGTA